MGTFVRHIPRSVTLHPALCSLFQRCSSLRCRQRLLRAWTFLPANQCAVTQPTRLWYHSCGALRGELARSILFSVQTYTPLACDVIHMCYVPSVSIVVSDRNMMSKLGLTHCTRITITLNPKLRTSGLDYPIFRRPSQGCPWRLLGRFQFQGLTSLEPHPRLTLTSPSFPRSPDAQQP